MIQRTGIPRGAELIGLPGRCQNPSLCEICSAGGGVVGVGRNGFPAAKTAPAASALPGITGRIGERVPIFAIAGEKARRSECLS